MDAYSHYGQTRGFMPSPGSPPPIDFEAIRAANPLSSVIGKTVKLIRAGREWKACCPFHKDRTPSFTIFADDRRYHCFGCGVSGDVLDYIQEAYCVGIREAAEMLGASSLPSSPTAAPRSTVPAEPEPDRLTDAIEIWQSAVSITGTPAEAYLRRRGITMALPRCLRFARIRYGSRGPLHPALIAAVQRPAGDLMGIQRTYLTEDGAKAGFTKAKLSLGHVRGGAIQLAPAAASILVTEGLEDGLTLAQALGRPVWVAAGTSMMPGMEFPPVIRAVVIGADGDGPGVEAARKAASAYTDGGRAVRIMRPATGFKDFNAELMGQRT